MRFEVILTKAVIKRLRRIRHPPVLRGVERVLDDLTVDALGPPPDKRGGWKDCFPSIPNHRHVDLPHGWRLCYFVESRKDQPDRVVVVFLGDHREYDHTYGFRPSG